jgi:hypothetical protein
MNSGEILNIKNFIKAMPGIVINDKNFKEEGPQFVSENPSGHGNRYSLKQYAKKYGNKS